MRCTALVALFAVMAFWQSQASGAGSDRAAAAGNWMTDGHGYDAQRYSPLARINERNVGRLGLQWFYDLDTLGGVEATPLAVDGVLYDISAWDITYVFDVKSGSLLWSYDPQVPKEWGRYACCEPVSRGLAWWQGHVIIATLDGRLISLDARTGKPVWKGIRSDRGMASFAKLLSPDDVDAIHGYIISRAQEDWGHQNEHQ
jgi:glucose dehydrogenase